MFIFISLQATRAIQPRNTVRRGHAILKSSKSHPINISGRMIESLEALAEQVLAKLGQPDIR